jgi:hypothetical protein
MKKTVFWDVAPCNLVDIALISVALTVSIVRVITVSGEVTVSVIREEAVSSSETLVNIYQTTRRNIPEDSHHHGCKTFVMINVIA